MITERFEKFKKMVKDEFGLTIVESDNKEQLEQLWDKMDSTEVEYIDFDGMLKKVSILNPILDNSECFIIEEDKDNESRRSR